jgi:hypothetical protein
MLHSQIAIQPSSLHPFYGSPLASNRTLHPSPHYSSPLVVFTSSYAEGPKRAAIGAVTCGILLGVIEGAGALVSRVFFADMNRPQMPQMPEAPPQAIAAH